MPLPLAQPPVQDRATYPVESANGIVDAPRLLALWHLTSLDAPTVAVAWSLGFAWAGNIHLAWRVPLLLALTVWWIYVSDRLLDARAGLSSRAPTALRERHYFHWRHRRWFVPLAAAAACISAVVAFVFMPAMMRERGSFLAAASLAYFSGVHARHQAPRSASFFPSPLLSKEFLVGLLFAAGCMLPAWPRLHAPAAAGSSIWLFWIPGIYFAALAWLNCWCIARWECADNGFDVRRRVDAQLPLFPSAAFTAAVLVAVGGLMLALIAPSSELRATMLLLAGALSALLLALLDRLRGHITPLALRAAADLVMLTPLLLVVR